MDLNGIFVPLITPFADDERIDLRALEALAHRAIDAGAAGLVALGTTGESSTLTPDERDAVATACVSVCRATGTPLIVGAGSNDTVATVRSVDHVRDLGADAALVVVPYYSRPTESGVVAHFLHVADRSPIPVLVYNVPHRTGVRLHAPALLELAGHPRIVGVKQSVGSVDDDTVRLLSTVPDDFAVLGGEDAQLTPMLALGASGGITACANVIPRAYTELAQACGRDDFATARRLSGPLVDVAEALLGQPNPTMIKAVVHAQGLLATPAVRLPLTPPPAGAVAAAVAVIERYPAITRADAPAHALSVGAPR
ncbi:4-hydroxy-tetrahydrodipicolinate synthase [Jongsikchunia kroppenstedtii]|uniref:4-hydroxy-tetrahydrodipicolinate synthase n=1 Tax=Jongsikchunia kroppenstedtii TaxID=1121721 RepID=UPI00037BDB97|nr:4-hydroxy-tetrahydrodipicolinate synthase [Jongsikchunia kroppenstedtii]